MRVSERQIARACVELFSEQKLSSHDVSRAVLRFLSKKHWIYRSERILAEVQRTLNTIQRVVPLTVTNIRILSDAEKKAIEQAMSRFFPDQHIQCAWRQDPRLIGGIILETENMRYAASLQVAIRKLSHSYSL